MEDSKVINEELNIDENQSSEVQTADANIAAEQSAAQNYKEMSPIRLVLRRFFRSKLSIVGIVIIVFLFAFSFLGPIFYNQWGETEVDSSQVSTYTDYEYKIIDEDGNEIVIIQQIEVKTDNIKAKPSWNHLLGTDDKGMRLVL